jgi:hypothetical protein
VNKEVNVEKVVTRFCIRNAIEVIVLAFLMLYFKSVSLVSLLPLVFVFFVFIFDFYKIYYFYKEQNLNGLLKFQSKLLFYTFAWYFLPILVSLYIILKKLNVLKSSNFVMVIFVYMVLYLYNLYASRKLKNNIT